VNNPPQPGTPEWDAYLAEGNAKQARKRVAADLLIRDQTGCILIVDPAYKPDWDLPGGMAEANEPPDLAAARELDEELGLTLISGRLLCVDWIPPHGPWDDQLAFLFDGGILGSDAAAALRPRDGEIGAIRFATPDEAPSSYAPTCGIAPATHLTRSAPAPPLTSTTAPPPVQTPPRAPAPTLATMQAPDHRRTIST
jgi:8-oxo-dGTP pyrophosphatase MutT (NUDIX family)